MMYGPTKIGVCSLCGGDVYEYDGEIWGNQHRPIPPARCGTCNAVRDKGKPKIIPMVPDKEDK